MNVSIWKSLFSAFLWECTKRIMVGTLHYAFSPKCSLLIPLKASENQMFSDVCKPNVFWCLQTKCFLMFARESKGNIAKKRVKRHGVIINCGINCSEVLINLFVTNVLILYSQKTLENLLFSDVFKGGIKWEH